MSRTMWILLVLLAILSIGTIWRQESGAPTPKHLMCKESLFIQVVTGACTLRIEGDTQQG